MLFALLTVGALLGIAVLTPSLIELRVYLGRRASGSGPILIDALLAAQLVLLAAFGFIALRLAGWNPGPTALYWIRLGLALAFFVKPWVTYVRLTHWKLRTPQGEIARELGGIDTPGGGIP